MLIGNISGLITQVVSNDAALKGDVGPVNTITTTDNMDGTFTWNYADGDSFTTSDLTGPAGAIGVGVTSVTKISTAGLVDTYEILYTDSSTSTFEVTNGEDGKSAYEIAVDEGFVGSQSDFIESLKGADGDDGVDGKSAYEVAVDNGSTDTVSNWLHSLKGADGKSAYELAVDEGFTGSLANWMSALKGIDGDHGTDGDDGDSVVVTSIVNNPDDTLEITFSDGFVHTTDSLRGVKGYSGRGITDITTIAMGSQSEENLYSVNYTDGTSTTIKVRNGDGIVNVVPLTANAESGAENVYGIHMSDGNIFPFSVWNGSDGNDGGGTGTGDCDYIRPTGSGITVGGAPSGSTFTGTVQDALDLILYPYQVPTFSSFSMSGQATVLEVGSTIASGSKTFNWSTTNDVNIDPLSISISDVSGGTSMLTGSDNDGTEVLTVPEITKSTATSYSWRIEGTNTNSAVFSRNYTVSWQWAIYYGESPLTTLLENDIEALRVKELRTSPVKSYSMNAGDYKWMCYPTSMGLKSTFKDPSTNFDVAMNPVETVSVTNSFGITIDYYCHRTYNVLGSSITIAMS